LYFLSEGESVYELESSPGGRTMPVLDASPSGLPVSAYVRRVEWEENRYYQAGLLDAPSLWLWDVVVSPGSKSYPFALSETQPGEAKLEVHLQGASDFEAAPEHRVRVAVNGVPVGEALWDGKSAKTLEAPLAAGVLREGANELSIENAGSTGVPYSMVFLDRFAVTYRRRPIAEGGVLEGVRRVGCRAIEGFRGSLWFRRLRKRRGLVAESVVCGRQAELSRPIARVGSKKVRAHGVRPEQPHRADYLLIGPSRVLPAAEPPSTSA
jgi:hypothetical protein